MRGFFTFAKQFIGFSSMKTQQMKVSIRFQLINYTQNQNCEKIIEELINLTIMVNLDCVPLQQHLEWLIQEVDGETELDIHISQLLSLSLKAEQQTIHTSI